MFTALHDVDVAAFLLIQQLPHPTWVIGLMWVLSLAGTAGCVWVVTATIIAIRNHDFSGLWRVLLAITFVIGIVDVGLKPLIDRDRPYEHSQTVASSMRSHRRRPSLLDTLPRLQLEHTRLHGWPPLQLLLSGLWR